MRTRIVAAALAACCLLLPSCAESKYPLGPIESAEQDTRVHGTWARTSADGEAEYVHVGREPELPFDESREDPEPALMRFWSVNLDPATGVVKNPFGLRGYRTRLGDADYANCILPAEPNAFPPKPLRYTFFKYRVSDDTLDVWGMDFEATGRVIEAGTLGGETERDDDGKLNRAFLTATTDELTTYLKDGGDTILFPEDHRATYIRQEKPPLDRR